MKRLYPLAITILLVVVSCRSSIAGIVQFDLLGKAGPGMLSGNENVAQINGNPGTGGEVGAGIFFDDVSKLLTINVGWGSAAGFTGSLTGLATGLHLHGPADLTQNAGILIGLDGLPGFNNAANGGGFNATLTTPLTLSQETNLLGGLLYINVHTASAGGGLNGGGELRGNLVAVPEPSSLALAALGALLTLRRRRSST